MAAFCFANFAYILIPAMRSGTAANKAANGAGMIAVKHMDVVHTAGKAALVADKIRPGIMGTAVAAKGAFPYLPDMVGIGAANETAEHTQGVFIKIVTDFCSTDQLAAITDAIRPAFMGTGISANRTNPLFPVMYSGTATDEATHDAGPFRCNSFMWACKATLCAAKILTIGRMLTLDPQGKNYAVFKGFTIAAISIEDGPILQQNAEAAFAGVGSLNPFKGVDRCPIIRHTPVAGITIFDGSRVQQNTICVNANCVA